MTKQKKIDYINAVNDRFLDARNHGNGNNWWYPVKNRMAYNVKMYHFGDVDKLREFLTQRQNDFYSDSHLLGIIEEDLTLNANCLAKDIEFEFGLEAGFAGRSDGWLEVDFENGLDYVDMDTAKEDIEYYFKKAKELEELEEKVKQFIEKQHSSYNKYVDTEQYYKDLTENCLLPDEDIADVYKNKIKQLTDKLQ